MTNAVHGVSSPTHYESEGFYKDPGLPIQYTGDYSTADGTSPYTCSMTAYAGESKSWEAQLVKTFG